MLKKLKEFFKNFLVITFEMVVSIIFSLPRYRIFIAMKQLLLIMMGAKFGKRVIIYPGVWMSPGRNLVVGDDVNIAKDVLITTSGGVIIGDRTLIGYRTQILSSNHTIPAIGKPFPISGDDHKKVVIEKDVWIGANCIICPGVTIGEGAVISAGSVVMRNVRKNSIVSGNPARILRMRTDENGT